MQILRRAGLPVIGDAFPEPWGEALREANEHGFYESDLRFGVFYATNPHPETGAYLFPDEVRGHAIKVFIPGLLRTELGFIDRCIVTVRHPREYVASMKRLRALEARAGASHGSQHPVAHEPAPAIVWWTEMFAAIRDVATRCYSAHFVTYDALLAHPKRVVSEVLSWIGAGDARAGAQAVTPHLRRHTSPDRKPTPEAGLDAEAWALCECLYDRIDRGEALDGDLVARLNEQQERLAPVLLRHRDLGAAVAT
jgi:hypothetical protein